jgi:hypothetical protein
MNIAMILTRKFPDAQWALDGNSYDGLTWLSEGGKPTEKQLEVLWPEVEFELAYEQVEQARALAYRETSDPIFFRAQRGSATEAEWLAAVQAVKDAHPYPGA